MNFPTFQPLDWKPLSVLGLLMISLGSRVDAVDAYPIATTIPPGNDLTTYVYWQGAASEARKPYEAELIKLLLRLSEEQYGRAAVEVSQRAMSTQRAIKIMRACKEIQVFTAPFMFRRLDEDAMIVLPDMILNNLLGYRQLIVRKQDVSRFSAIDSREEFFKLAAGQGAGWGDIDVYKYNDLRVAQANTFEGLFPMLKYQRFDYIPLGISEAEQTFAMENLQEKGFALVDNLIVFYPWPVQIMVSRAHPKLAERLNFGMRMAKQNGEYDALFDRHFQSTIAKFNTSDTRIVKLKTPYIDDSVVLPPILLDKAYIIE